MSPYPTVVIVTIAHHSPTGIDGLPHRDRRLSWPENQPRDQSDRDGGEVVVGVVLDSLGVVDEGCRDDDADDKEEDQKHQLMGARLERVDKDLEAWRVPR